MDPRAGLAEENFRRLPNGIKNSIGPRMQELTCDIDADVRDGWRDTRTCGLPSPLTMKAGGREAGRRRASDPEANPLYLTFLGGLLTSFDFLSKSITCASNSQPMISEKIRKIPIDRPASNPPQLRPDRSLRQFAPLQVHCCTRDIV